ncbi:MAG: class I SAM-dependent methyltransferase [Candidatus Solibacter sp.]
MRSLLDDTLTALRDAVPVEHSIRTLAEELHEFRRTLPVEEWRHWATRNLREHQLYPVLLEDPFAQHSARRPRGYPGDAELLDYIYESANVRSSVERSSERGQRIYGYTHRAPAPAAVRSRLALAVEEIERMADGGGRPHILSVACGHLREAPQLKSLQAGMLGRFVALDQDPLSLELVRRDWAHRGVEVREGSALGIIRTGRQDLGSFDFIYALGLYDYLSDEAGRRLLAAAVDMLNPGGKVWVANFTEDLWSTGYMEAVMDWWLVYRSEQHLAGMAEYVDRAKIASQRTFFECEKNVAILEVVKA